MFSRYVFKKGLKGKSTKISYISGIISPIINIKLFIYLFNLKLINYTRHICIVISYLLCLI